MNSPSFIKLQNLQAVARYTETVGQPLVLTQHDRDVFPPIHYPLPTLNRVPEGWGVGNVLDNPTWDELTAELEAHPEHGFAILGNQFNNGPGHVGRFVRL